MEREIIEEALADNSEMLEPQHNYGLTNKILNTCSAIKLSFKGQLPLELKAVNIQKTSLDLFSEE